MPDTTIKTFEPELLRLLEPFRANEDNDETPRAEARALLDFVDEILENDQEGQIETQAWHDYLDTTRRPCFLTALESHEARLQWADIMFRIVDFSSYSLRNMFEQRVHEHPNRALFQQAHKPDSLWTYEQVYAYMKKIAAVFYSAAEQPRVLLYKENCPEGACADLACLTFGILDSPVDRHFDRDTIAYIVKRLGINIVVTDSEARLHRLIKVQKQTGIPFKIFVVMIML